MMKISRHLTPDAKVVVDGVNQIPVFRVFTSKEGPRHSHVGTNGKLISATKTDKATGKYTVNLIAMA
jgi:hypothetical protein